MTATGTLAEANPLRYRGYYFDSETGFYYLQSRYYDPEICRFINADGYASTGQGIVGNNMFAYCNNNPANCLDSAGTDAIWIQEHGAAGTFGHAGLLVQDGNDVWYFFYWGNGGPWYEMFSGTTAAYTLDKVEIDVSQYNLRDSGEVSDLMLLMGGTAAARSPNVSSVSYFVGDYTKTFDYLVKLNPEFSGKKYELCNDNCVQECWAAMAESNPRFSVGKPLVPNYTYRAVATICAQEAIVRWISLVRNNFYQ